MCVTPQKAELKKVRARKSRVIKVWKILTKRGCSEMFNPRTARGGVKYGPGWNDAEQVIPGVRSIGPLPKRCKYDRDTPVGIHAYRSKRDWDTLIPCYVKPEEVLAADVNQLAARRVYFRRKDWEAAGFPMRKPHRAKP